MNQLQSTNSPQTSAPPPSEPCATVDAICGTHGPYQARILGGDEAFGIKPIRSGCPTCAAEARAREAAAQERRERAHREFELSVLRRDSGIPARFADRTFAGYTASGQGQKIALGVCRAFAESWPEKRVDGASLVLTGGPGTGKTHLACAVGNHVMAEHLGAVHFATVATLLRGIKDTYRKDSTASEQDAINALLRPALLIVDEVGVQVGSEHEKLLMFEVLNLRYQELAPTILISNLNAAEIENFLGQRVMDRYRECGSVLAFDWDSYRGRQ
jgi:DNA replication protein DnaC